MIIVVSCSILCLLFTYLESVGKMENGMKWGFVLITALGCLHYNYGNDYESYYNIGQLVQSTPFNIGDIFSGYIHKDSGWVLLNYLFKPIGGFFVMVAVLNIVQNSIIYSFIRRNVSAEWWVLSVFFFLFVERYYLMSFSMMRQSFVMYVLLALWPLIRGRKFAITLPILYGLSFIHHSVLILLPFAFWGFIPFGKKRWFGIVVVVLYLLLWLNNDFLNSTFDTAVSVGDFDTYVETYGEGESDKTLGIGFILNQIPIFVVLAYFFNRSENIKDIDAHLMAFAAVGIMITPLCQVVPMAGRVGLYFDVFSIAVIPIAFSRIKNINLRTALLVLYIMITVYSYIIFFLTPGWFHYYGTFHTIFEAL